MERRVQTTRPAYHDNACSLPTKAAETGILNMDWTAFAIGAIPSLLAFITFLLQLRRDKLKDQASSKKTRAEAAHEIADAEKTRVEATEKIVSMYEAIIERLEKQVEELESE